MIINIDASGALRLDDAANFRGFHIAGQRPADPTVYAARGLHFDDDLGHAWVEPNAVRTLVGIVADPEWVEGFNAMVGYATSKGWTDDHGRIRAHTEWADGASS